MSYLNNAQKMNEIIFANRNKRYGAYEIRSSYGHTIFKSLIIVAGSAGLLCAGAYLLNERPQTTAEKSFIVQDSIYVTEVNNAAEMPKEKKPAAAPEPSPGSENTATENSTTIVDSADIASNTTTVNSLPSGSVSVATEPVSGLAGTGTVTENGSGEKNIGPEIRSDHMVDHLPEFEGGLKELYKFISRNLHYPVEASEAGISAKVIVRFVVDEEGKVSMVTALNKPGYGLEDEAMRVVRLIPKFKTAATIGNKPVKVYYQLPINFKSQ